MEPFICPDCETYPPHITSQEIFVNGVEGIAFECRDCGEYWEEIQTPAENFFENIQVDDE